MKKQHNYLVFIVVLLFFVGCRATKKINKAITPVKQPISADNKQIADSIEHVKKNLFKLKSNYIDFTTFNAKIKVESSGVNGKNPDITAVVRIIKDSAIWMSLSASFLNVEVYRVFITKDSMILINKQDKEVKFRSLDYLQELTQIPFDFKTLQNIIIGNPVFISDSINAFREKDGYVYLTTIDEYFKNLLTISNSNHLMLHSKMDDVDLTRSRTADIVYDGYEISNGVSFSKERQIVASEKNRLDIRLSFKQYEFNKELSIAFNVPKSYKRK